MSRWWRAYDEALDDPKLQKLGLEMIGAWFNLLCMASRNNGAIMVADVPFSLRVPKAKAAEVITRLVTAGLLDRKGNDYEPHKWGVRQYHSDSSSERVEKYRNKRRDAGLPALGDYSRFKPALLARDGERCVYCDAVGKLVVDHMVPIALGGTDHEDNLALACKPCNSGKAGRTPELAGMTIRVSTALCAYCRYRDNQPSVTVTETPPEQIQKTDTEKKEDCRESVPTRYPEDFENGFWKPYPRTPIMSKKDALTAWKRLALEDREKAVAAVNPYLAFLRSKPDHPAVHACRFLSQRRFDGFAAAPQEAEQRKIIRPRHGQILGPEFGEKAAGRIFVLAETPEWDAWCGYVRDLGKPAPPRYFHEGWAFPSLWPPGYEPQTEAAE